MPTGTRLDLLDNLPKNAICGELGIWKGDFSKEILLRCKPRRLYLVDIFCGLIHSGDHNGDGVEVIDMAEEKERIRKRFYNNPEVVIVESDSAHWLSLCGRGLLDWVYIDTTHTEGQTRAELEAAKCAVRQGGVIAGHDYSDQFPGVMNAVNEFCVKYGLLLELWTGDKLASYKIAL